MSEDTDAPVEMIIDAGTLSRLVEFPNTLVDECKVRCTEDGLSITAVDPANIGMVRLSLDAAAFESYNVSESTTLGVTLTRLSDIIGMATADDLVHLELDPETRTLHIESGGLSYSLALIDPGAIRAEPDIPDLELPAEITVEGRHLSRGTTAADLVSDHIAVATNPSGAGGDGTLLLQAEGDTDDIEQTIAPDDYASAAVPEAVTSLFSLRYVKDVITPIDADCEVTLRVGDEFPVDLTFGWAEGHGDAQFILAPRIESDAASGGA